MGNSLAKKLEGELAIFAARLESGQKIMMERYRIKALSMEFRGAEADLITAYFKEDSGRMEWEAMKKEAMKAAGNIIGRASDFGYYLGYAYGKRKGN